MLINIFKNKVSLLRLPLYRFCNNTETPSSKISVPSKLNKADRLTEKKENKQYLMLPLRTFIFPHKPYSMRVDRIFYQLLQKHDIK